LDGVEQLGEEYNLVMSVDESKFPYGYVPEHLKESVKNWRNLSASERSNLCCELSEAAWAKIGVVYDPNKPSDKTIRKITRSDWGGIIGFAAPLRGAMALWAAFPGFHPGLFSPTPSGSDFIAGFQVLLC
jgi:hypothetical protein